MSRTADRCASWLEISASRLAANFHALGRAAGPQTGLLAVIKANAYGHDAELCAPVLAGAGARWLGVTSALDGARLRGVLTAYPDAEILLMSGILPGDVEDVLQHRLTPVVWTAEQVRALAGSGVRPVHVEIDTGMGRGGVTPGAELEGLLRALRTSGVPLGAVSTHFASSEVAGSALTQEQRRGFEQAVGQVRGRGLRPAWVHAGNTSTVDNPAQPASWLVELAATVGARAMVRPGLALYGYCLAVAGGGAHHVRPALKPVMQWKAPVLSVRELAAGQTVGYNAMYTTPRAMRVALLPVGYADGLRRELSSANLPGQERAGGWCMLHRQRAPILGRVSMNLTVVDVSAIAEAEAGDEAVVLGEGFDADEHARLAGTIAYEILCGVRAGRTRLTA